MSNRETKNYFAELIDSRIKHSQTSHVQDPIFIYHHRADGSLDVFSSLFEMIHSRGISAVSLLDYARWWHNRCAIKWNGSLENGRVLLKMNEWALVPMDELIDLEYVQWRSTERENGMTPSMAQLDRYGWRMFKDDLARIYWKFRT